MKTIKSTIALLIVSLLILLPGCQDSQSLNATEQAQFAAYLEQTFVERISQNTTDIRYILKNPETYGIDRTNVTLGDYTPEGVVAQWEEEQENLVQLQAFDRDRLTAEQQREYDILVDYGEALLDEEFILYQNMMSPADGVTVQFPVILAEIKFYTRQDIDEYLLLLGDMPRAFDEVALYLQAQSEAGLFMPDYAVDKVLEQMEAFTGQRVDQDAGQSVDQDARQTDGSVEQNILSLSFEERLNGLADLTDSERERYVESNRAAITDSVFPAYRELGEVLRSLKGTGENEQ
ncbi:MAG: DUF885 family protein, partial [Lachnospiraceae bacterium]|nr:DUF885 family protein [Lachnospiraceae bacterium]